MPSDDGTRGARRFGIHVASTTVMIVMTDIDAVG